jgi:hypothetical protein
MELAVIASVHQKFSKQYKYLYSLSDDKKIRSFWSSIRDVWVASGRVM